MDKSRSVEVRPESIPQLARIFGSSQKSVTLVGLPSKGLDGAYWDGGSRNQYSGHDCNGNPAQLPPHGGAPQFGGTSPTVKLRELNGSDGFGFVVNRSGFRGKTYVYVYCHPTVFDAIYKPAPEPELTDIEICALVVTAHLKSAGRADEFGRYFSPLLWEPTRERLREKGLLAKNNSISVEGRNIADAHRRRFSYGGKILPREGN